MWWSVSPSSALRCLLVSERCYDKEVQCSSLKDFASLTLQGNPTEVSRYAKRVERDMTE